MAQATRNTRQTVSTWPAWVIGATTKTSRSRLTAWEVSASSSKPMFTEQVSLTCRHTKPPLQMLTFNLQASTSPPTPSRTKPRPKVSRRWPSVQGTRYTVSRTTLSGTKTQTRNPATLNAGVMAEKVLWVGPCCTFLVSIDTHCCCLRLYCSFGESEKVHFSTSKEILLSTLC